MYRLKIDGTKGALETIRKEMSSKKASMAKIKSAYDRFTGWVDEFALATIERKKMIISQLVSRIEVSKRYKINLVHNIDYEIFCEGWDELNNKSIFKRHTLKRQSRNSLPLIWN